MLAETHPVQVGFMLALLVLNVGGFAVVNNIRKRQYEAGVYVDMPWPTRRNILWFAMGMLVATSCALDAFYPIGGVYVYHIKSALQAIPIGLIDMYFSKTDAMPWKVLPDYYINKLGAILLFLYVSEIWLGGNTVIMLKPMDYFNAQSLTREFIRYVLYLVTMPLCMDFFYSPFHRMMHRPKLYKFVHKEHHSQVEHLNALAGFNQDFWDGVVLVICTFLGLAAHYVLLGYLGLQHESKSNLTFYVVELNALFSHAHDIRCATLLTPFLPQALNPAAHHSIHHRNPNKNFGLVLLTDLLWDKILGVNTIAYYEDFAKKDD